MYLVLSLDLMLWIFMHVVTVQLRKIFLWVLWQVWYVCFMCAWSHSSCVQFFVTPWTVAQEAPLSMGFSRQEHWSGLPCPAPGNPQFNLSILLIMAFVLLLGFASCGPGYQILSMGIFVHFFYLGKNLRVK